VFLQLFVKQCDLYNQSIFFWQEHTADIQTGAAALYARILSNAAKKECGVPNADALCPGLFILCPRPYPARMNLSGWRPGGPSGLQEFQKNKDNS
jgi:hypothetical protein